MSALNQDDLRDLQITKGVLRGHTFMPRQYDPPSYQVDTWLCRVCRGPRKALNDGKARYSVKLECGHTESLYSACAAVIKEKS